ncbi:3-methyl-2-oxobutanoate hydroxymethyltransferase [Alginatibacterium sediminis]|uniref:3-methyl-2-oxobutanoate hydroxymethyltransferase n=1 Tax=Alginatibacterium sediminis TaxID=2164068 RepID=A0A420E8R4_9ALTE|nr:3-methyl-2-oxobutanoate hydroxymethyltransferase [Alginatibacterium sediminis]RKF15856.1 3-methyl-2-oxobutanoate hydroxymethyltransferase [Alginatibacterium sediminis]
MKKQTVSSLLAKKQQGEKIATITAYDASFAAIFDSADIDMILIGDSLGNVLQGHKNTIPVTVDDIAYHTSCVVRGTDRPLIVADLPFMSYSSPEQAYENAAKLMRAGANMVKFEGGKWLAETVSALVERAVPVCGHLGLTPQAVNVLGGFKVQGREDAAAEQMLADAIALEAAGIQLLVIECVPADLGKRIAQALSIPVIGIGAGVDTDGQILVMHDALGITQGRVPKFSKNFLAHSDSLLGASELYVNQVRSGEFPSDEHSF